MTWAPTTNGLFEHRDVPLLSGEPGESYKLRDGIWQPPLPDNGITPPSFLVSTYAPYTTSMILGGSPKNPKPDEIDTTRTDPFVGWKTLTIKVTKKGNLRFIGAGFVKYSTDAAAECNRGESHAVPDWDCSCGFYALSQKPNTPELGWFMAQVELFGTVIEGEYGWRASRQRVLSMEVFRGCQADDGDCGDDAAGFQVSRGGKVWPVCVRHAPLGFATLPDLTAQLGTEVRWASS